MRSRIRRPRRSEPGCALPRADGRPGRRPPGRSARMGGPLVGRNPPGTGPETRERRTGDQARSSIGGDHARECLVRLAAGRRPGTEPRLPLPSAGLRRPCRGLRYTGRGQRQGRGLVRRTVAGRGTYASPFGRRGRRRPRQRAGRRRRERAVPVEVREDRQAGPRLRRRGSRRRGCLRGCLRGCRCGRGHGHGS